MPFNVSLCKLQFILTYIIRKKAQPWPDAFLLRPREKNSISTRNVSLLLVAKLKLKLLTYFSQCAKSDIKIVQLFVKSCTLCQTRLHFCPYRKCSQLQHYLTGLCAICLVPKYATLLSLQKVFTEII